MSNKVRLASLITAVGAALTLAIVALGGAAGATPPGPYPSGGTSAPGSTTGSPTGSPTKLPPHGGSIVVAPTGPKVGGTIHIEGSGATPNGQVAADLHTTVYRLGTATANKQGHFSFSVTLPSGVSGNHTVVVTDLSSGAVLGSVAISIGGHGANAGGSGTGGVTAATGVAVAGIGALGLALLIGGGLMLMAGRRQRRHA